MLRPFVGRILRRLDLKLVPYHETYVARRQQLLRAAGVTTLLDIGANSGQYGTTVRHYGYRGQLISFEPLTRPFIELEQRAAPVEAWEVQRLAVGSHVGRIEIRISENDQFSSALPLSRIATDAFPHARLVGSEEVDVVTIDDVIASRGIDPRRAGVKIDVQGFERDVLAGAQESLALIPYLEMELSPRPVYEGQMVLDEALTVTRAAGLTLVLVENLTPTQRTGEALQFDGIFCRL